MVSVIEENADQVHQYKQVPGGILAEYEIKVTRINHCVVVKPSRELY